MGRSDCYIVSTKSNKETFRKVFPEILKYLLQNFWKSGGNVPCTGDGLFPVLRTGDGLLQVEILNPSSNL